MTLNNNLSRLWRDFLPLMACMLLIFLLSSRSRLIDIEEPFLSTLFYKSAHVTIYTILMGLWWRALSPTRLVTWSILGQAYISTILYAISDEIHQSFVPGRHAHFADIMFDAAGALIALIIIRWLNQIRNKMAINPQ